MTTTRDNDQHQPNVSLNVITFVGWTGAGIGPIRLLVNSQGHTVDPRLVFAEQIQSERSTHDQ